MTLRTGFEKRAGSSMQDINEDPVHINPKSVEILLGVEVSNRTAWN
jgi:hypothetical protein